MTQYHITILSKNHNSIKNFFIFFNQALKNFNVIKKFIKKKKKKNFLTILKSPHVNKTAQEQFETRLFKRQISICYSQKNLQFLISLKKAKIYLFPDIRIKAQFTINSLLTQKTQSKIINPDNFKLDFFNNQLKNSALKNLKQYKENKKNFNIKQTKYLLQILDIYGNLIKNMFR